MEYGLQTVGSSYDEFLAAARWAEHKGLSAFAIPDHYLYGTPEAAPRPAYDAFAIMAGLARETRRIELVILVSPITFRHPAVLAKSAATIQQMSGGRFKLGVGTGWLESEHKQFGFDFPNTKQRFTLLEESLGYLRAAFSEPPVDYQGENFQFTAFDMQPRPELKLVVGGTGAVSTPRLAGTYADELNAYPAMPDEYQTKIERARAAAVTSGRDPSRLLISSSGQVIAADSEQDYQDRLAELASEHGTTPEELEAAAARRNSPRGTWDQVRAILWGMEAAGMRRFYFQGEFDAADIELKMEKLT